MIGQCELCSWLFETGVTKILPREIPMSFATLRRLRYIVLILIRADMAASQRNAVRIRINTTTALFTNSVYYYNALNQIPSVRSWTWSLERENCTKRDIAAEGWAAQLLCLTCERRIHNHSIFEKLHLNISVFGHRLITSQSPVSSEISDLCEISDLLLFVSYFSSESKGIKFGDYFFDVCYVNWNLWLDVTYPQ